ncbi:complex I subunit 4 family protein [Flavobacterium rhizosphaerae]|uniref:NADH-quinone oxidoreductase subunit M n=1 Tax=Flavobacterium rhizosphaerae TaxID=3163298 RepID=A0ABW8YSB5_9FLAO
MDVSFILVILLFGAAATWFVGDKWASKAALIFSTAAFAATLYIMYRLGQGERVSYFHQWISNPRITLALQADGMSMTMVLLTTALTPLIVYTSFGNLFPKTKNFYALIMFMAFAMVGSFLSVDGLLYYIFWELSLIPIYFIALIWGSGDAEERKKAVVKFFIYTFAGSLFMLAAFAYLYRKTGSLLDLHLYHAQLTSTEQSWIFAAFFLAYAIKIPIVPFHTWQANVYQKAPAAGTMLLSGIMLKMALFSIIKWQLPITPYAASQHKTICIALCIAGVIYGSVLALKQTNLKRLLAYSSLAHVGLIAAGAYTLTLDGLRGAFIQMLAHGFVVVGLFFAAEIIERRYKTGEISEMGGIRVQTPKFASMFMILVLASVALPGTFNFVGEFELLYSLAQANIWYAILGGTTIILGAFYMLRMFQHVMLGERNAKPFADVTFNEGLVFVIIIGVLLFFGLYPKPLVDFVTPALEKVLVYITRFE